MALLSGALVVMVGLVLVPVLPVVHSWDDGSVLLRDVQVLTLHSDRYTTARRSSPVPQLKCVGGSAGCSAFVPQVVQCQNRGWDGVDVQWECRTDMDNAYRFGHIEVSCEGYQSPSDPYILKGSCGLEFTLDLTEEGKRGRGSDRRSGGLGGVASGLFGGSYGNGRKSWPEGGGEGEGLLVVVGLLFLAFVVYKMFLSGNTNQGGPPPAEAAPPPPGFKPDFTGFPDANAGFSGANAGFSGANAGYSGANAGFPGANAGYSGANNGFYGFNAGSTRGHHRSQGFAAPRTGGGFWTGMGAGGLMGYLFGQHRSRTSNSSYQNYSTYSHGRPNVSAPSSSGTHTSSGTRTASGFGGTKKR